MYLAVSVSHFKVRVNLDLPSSSLAGRTEFQGEIVVQGRQSLEVVLKLGTYLNTFLLVPFLFVFFFPCGNVQTYKK